MNSVTGKDNSNGMKYPKSMSNLMLYQRQLLGSPMIKRLVVNGPSRTTQHLHQMLPECLVKKYLSLGDHCGGQRGYQNINSNYSSSIYCLKDTYVLTISQEILDLLAEQLDPFYL